MEVVYAHEGRGFGIDGGDDAGDGARVPCAGRQARSHDPDIVAKYDWVRPEADFVRQEVMIPMRDGVKLHTFIVYRKGTTDAPIILSRSPYNADGHTSRNRSQKIEEILPVADKNSSMTAISASIRTCAG
jgi:predicted acyl esterase